MVMKKQNPKEGVRRAQGPDGGSWRPKPPGKESLSESSPDRKGGYAAQPPGRPTGFHGEEDISFASPKKKCLKFAGGGGGACG